MTSRRSHLLFLILISLTIFSAAPAFGQWDWYNRVTITDDGVMMGGLGMAFIDDETFFVFNLRSELVLGQFGVGIDVPLRFNTANGELRDADWNSTYDYFRILRYIRYGMKRRTPIYARLGTLSTARLGHGFIMNYYTNEANYDDRKIGLEFDWRFGVWGFESVVSNFERLEIVGGRAYVQPLKLVLKTPIIRNLTFGATLVTDDDPDGTRSTDDGVTIGGLDVELPLLRKGPFFSSIYSDFAKIDNFGSGAAVGIEFGLLKVGGIFNMYSKLERRFLGKNFLPSYFGPFYEIERFQPDPITPVRKTDQLLARTTREQGIYGELFGDFINFIRILGAYELIDGQANSGRLHAAALLSRSIARFSARAIYDKTGVEDFADAFTLNERSIARAGLGYQIHSFIYLFMDYIWTFERNSTTGRLESQRRVEPQLSFVMPLNFGGK
jgi:hypothetical protein